MSLHATNARNAAACMGFVCYMQQGALSSVTWNGAFAKPTANERDEMNVHTGTLADGLVWSDAVSKQ